MAALGEKATILRLQLNGRLPLLKRTIVPEAGMAAVDPKRTLCGLCKRRKENAATYERRKRLVIPTFHS